MGGFIVKKGTRKWRQEEKKKERLQAWHEKKELRKQKQGHTHGHGLHQQGGVVGIGGEVATVGRGGLALLQYQKQQQQQEEEEEEDEGVEGVRVGTVHEVVSGGGGDKGFRVPGMGGARHFGFKKAVRYTRNALRRVHGGKKGQGKGKLVHLV